MFEAGGAAVSPLGFVRGAADAASMPAGLLLGRTRDARLAQRALSVAAALARLPRTRAAVAQADIIVARQLEMLAIAAASRARYRPGATLVYECLDIHRMMTAPGIAGTLLRGLERRLLAGCTGLMVSAPGFIANHFKKSVGGLPEILLVENKMLLAELAGMRPAPRRPPGPPWRIGWFGVIRCHRSLHMLADLARALPGMVEIEIRGRVAPSTVPDFDAVVAGTPGMNFLGPYDRRRDLAAMYGGVHFVWSIDYFEAGTNSDWLLPNRIYEGGLFGAVPLALGSVATGAWLHSRGAGVVLPDDPLPALRARLAAMTPDEAAALTAQLAAIPDTDFVAETPECETLVARLAGRIMPAASERVGRARAA